LLPERTQRFKMERSLSGWKRADLFPQEFSGTYPHLGQLEGEEKGGAKNYRGECTRGKRGSKGRHGVHGR